MFFRIAGMSSELPIVTTHKKVISRIEVLIEPQISRLRAKVSFFCGPSVPNETSDGSGDYRLCVQCTQPVIKMLNTYRTMYTVHYSVHLDSVRK
jgi:hypothetical protein